MLQHRFNFDKRATEDPEYIVLATSLLPPLVRPDRQLTYGGDDHDFWPKPTHDHDTITVDRARDDIDGPAHRFVIKRGDTVEVFSKDRLQIGNVIDINHRRNEVQILCPKDCKGEWFSKDQIYPTPKSLPLPLRRKR